MFRETFHVTIGQKAPQSWDCSSQKDWCHWAEVVTLVARILRHNHVMFPSTFSSSAAPPSASSRCLLPPSTPHQGVSLLQLLNSQPILSPPLLVFNCWPSPMWGQLYLTGKNDVTQITIIGCEVPLSGPDSFCLSFGDLVHKMRERTQSSWHCQEDVSWFMQNTVGSMRPNVNPPHNNIITVVTVQFKC